MRNPGSVSLSTWEIKHAVNTMVKVIYITSNEDEEEPKDDTGIQRGVFTCKFVLLPPLH